MKSINLSITQCYRPNANFKGQQYQFNLNNEYSIAGGFLNSASDIDRIHDVTIYKQLTDSEYLELKSIIDSYKKNVLTYYQPYNDTFKFNKVANKKQLKAIQAASMANYKVQSEFCEKHNSKLKRKAALKIWQLHFKNYCNFKTFLSTFFW